MCSSNPQEGKKRETDEWETEETEKIQNKMADLSLTYL